jgi:transglutaminase-like putative cysteine protease
MGTNEQNTAIDVRPDQCLSSTYFLDYENPAVSLFAARHCAHAASERERAVALYYAVRDEIRYDAYRIDLSREGLRASHALASGYSFCIPKAALLAAAARSVGIPARLGFADVRNHLTTEKLRRVMMTDVFIFHAYCELWIEGRWVKATPAFNRELCSKFGIRPLEFDGMADSIFHEFSATGERHMEYVRERGVFPDIPFDLLHSVLRAEMPALFRPEFRKIHGDFTEDAALERARRTVD